MELRQSIVIDADASKAVSALKQAGAAADETGQKVESAGKKAGASAAGFGQLERGLNSLERQIVRMAGTWLLYKGIFEGIKGADEISDLQKQIDNLTHSVGAGAQAMSFFESVQTRTRATTQELLKVYEALAASNLGKGGFTEGQLQKFTVELVNAGTAAGITTPKMLAFWEAVKRGEGARFDKDTMSKLGINNKTAQDLDAVRKRIEELSEQGEKMGLTFETAGKKIASSWAIAFAGGMGGDQKTAYADMVAKLTSPEILTAISQIGAGVVQVLAGIGGFVQTLVGIIQAIFGLVEGIVGTVAKFLDDTFAALFKKISEGFGWLEKMTGGKLFGPQRQHFANESQYYSNESLQADVFKQGGFDTMLNGLGQIQSAWSGSTEAANKFSESLKTNAGHLDTNADKTAKLAKEAARLKAQLDLFARQDAQFENFNEKVNAAFDIGDENESPYDRKIKQLRKTAAQDIIEAQKQISLAEDMINHGYATGDNKEIEQGVKLWTEYETVLQEIPGKLDKATDAEKVKQQAEETRKLAESWNKVDLAVTNLSNATRNAVQGFENPGLNSFALNIARGMADVIAQMNALKEQPITPFANADERDKWLDDQIKTYEKIGQQFIKDNETAAARWKAKVGDGLTSVFTDILTTGGQNFGQIAGQMFNKIVAEQAGKLSDMFSSAIISAFGGDILPESQYHPAEHGGKSYTDYVSDQQAKQDKIAGIVSGSLAAIGQTIQMFQNAAKGQQTSVIGSTLSFAAVGASIGTAIAPGLGTIIGALVGALVGGIMAAIANAKAKKELPFAAYGLDKNGNPFITPMGGYEENFGHISAKEMYDMQQQMIKVRDEVLTSFIKLLIKLPHDAATYFGLPPGGQGNGGPLTPGIKDTWTDELQTLRNFSSDFNLWVNNILPHQLADRFHDEVQRGFTALGMSADAFERFWTKVQGMDPKEGMQVLNNTADALIAFNNALRYSNAVYGTFMGAFGTNNQIDKFGNSTAGETEWDRKMADYKQKFADLAIEVQTLPFADAAASAAELGAGITELQANLTTFLNDLLAKSKSISEAIDQDRLQAEVQHAGSNKGAVSKIYEDRYKQDIYKVDHWKELGLSADEVQKYINDAREMAKNIYNLDPKGRYDWYMSQLDQIDKWQQEIFKAIGQQAIDATNALLASVQPAMDWFKSLPDADHLGGSFTAVAQSANAAAEALWGVAGQHHGDHAANASEQASSSTRSTSANSHIVVTVDDPQGYVHSVRGQRVAR